MTDLTPNHPAVKAGCQAASEWVDDASVDAPDPTALALHMTAACITAALPHLTADDLRDTPVVRMLMAEAWDEGARFAQGGRVYNNSNPYLEDDA